MSEDSPIVYVIPFWGLFFVAIWAVWNILRDSRQEREALRAAKWPEIRGIVKTSKIVWGHFEVQYEFTVKGRIYSGKHILNLPPVVPGRSAAGTRQYTAESKQDLAQYPPGSEIIVKFNPNRREESILLCRAPVTREPTQESEPPKFELIS